MSYHAVVITGTNSNGDFTFYDPQNGLEGIILASKADKLTYGGY